MKSEWQELLLEDCMDAIIDYRGKTPTKTDSGIPLITAKIIKDGRISPVSEYIAEDDYDSWMRRGIPSPGDVVMTTEAPLGEIAQLDERKVALAQRVITLRGKEGLLDNTFLKYLMLSHYVQHQLDGRGTGTTVKGIKQSELRQVLLKFPSFPEQKAIAHILSSLDGKIELNRQINTTLENMAQDLFKSWFVDFDPVLDNALESGNPIPEALADKAAARKALGDARKPLPEDIRELFPASFVWTEEMGWLPKGWGIYTLDKAASLIIDHRGKTPKKLGGDWAESGYPAISAKNVKGRKLVRPDTVRYVSEDMYIRWMKEPLQQGDIALTSEAPLGEIYYFASKHDYLLSQRLYGIRANKNICSGSYMFHWFQTELAKTDLLNRATGTTVTGIRQSELRKAPILSPTKNVIAAYSKLAEHYLLRIDQNDSQNTQLSGLRDTLLPKLLSGELRIPDAEKLIEEAL